MLDAPAPPRFKHHAVLEEIERRIFTGVYPPGGRLPSESLLTREFETSRITVGRAMQELQRRGLVERRAGSGTYVKSGTERQSFGLLIPGLGETEIFEPICRGIAEALPPLGPALLWGNAPSGAEQAKQALALCDQFVERRVAGVFFAPLERVPDAAEVNAEIGERLRRAHIPVVLLDRAIDPYPVPPAFDIVSLDHSRAGFMAAAHLLERGARRLAFWSLAGQADSVEARASGVQAAVLRHPGAVVECFAFQELDDEPVRQADQRFRPDAIVCANDRLAAEVMRLLRGWNRRIPADVMLAGIDDTPYAAFLPSPLTTIRQPCRDIGRAALHAMLDRLAHPDLPPRQILLAGQLVVRESSGG
jgi:DNA-binding LacI/PurR family transcriptional regulator